MVDYVPSTYLPPMNSQARNDSAGGPYEAPGLQSRPASDQRSAETGLVSRPLNDHHPPVSTPYESVRRSGGLLPPVNVQSGASQPGYHGQLPANPESYGTTAGVAVDPVSSNHQRLGGVENASRPCYQQARAHDRDVQHTHRSGHTASESNGHDQGRPLSGHEQTQPPSASCSSSQQDPNARPFPNYQPVGSGFHHAPANVGAWGHESSNVSGPASPGGGQQRPVSLEQDAFGGFIARPDDQSYNARDRKFSSGYCSEEHEGAPVQTQTVSERLPGSIFASSCQQDGMTAWTRSPFWHGPGGNPG